MTSDDTRLNYDPTARGAGSRRKWYGFHSDGSRFRNHKPLLVCQECGKRWKPHYLRKRCPKCRGELKEEDKANAARETE